MASKTRKPRFAGLVGAFIFSVDSGQKRIATHFRFPTHTVERWSRGEEEPSEELQQRFVLWIRSELLRHRTEFAFAERVTRFLHTAQGGRERLALTFRVTLKTVDLWESGEVEPINGARLRVEAFLDAEKNTRLNKTRP